MEFGAPASTSHVSTLPSSVFTSRVIQLWGLIHSIFFTVPRNVTGFVLSYSALNAWCATTGAARAISRPPAPAIIIDSLFRIGSASGSFNRALVAAVYDRRRFRNV